MRLTEREELRDRTGVFKDREEAGNVLAAMLDGKIPRSGIALAIPAGGIPAAKAISEALGIEMGVVIVRKITLPWDSEAGIGAVGPDGKPVFNTRLLDQLQLSQEEILRQQGVALRSVKDREELLLGGRTYPVIADRAAVLVDDGLASGYTMLAGVRFVKGRGASRVLVAVPKASILAIRMLGDLVDQIFCPNIRTGQFFAVADAYEHWEDIPEERALEILGAGHQEGVSR